MNILHLVDADCPQIGCATVRLLIERLDPARFAQRVVALGDGGHLDWLAREKLSFQRVALRGRAEPARSLPLGRLLSRESAAGPGRPPSGLLHAHSPRAAVCATVAGLLRHAIRRCPVAVEVYRRPPARQLRWLAACRGRFELHFLARSPRLRQMLLAGGVGAEQAGVLGPALDMGRTNAADRGAVRRGLGLADGDGPVLLAGGWCRRGDGQRLALWSAAILSMLYPRLRMVVPGDGPLGGPLAGWIAGAGFGRMAAFAGRRFDWPELLAAADLLVHAGEDGADATPLGWAMAAGRPIVAVATPAAGELIQDRRSGLLCPTPQPRELARCIRLLLGDEPLAGRLADQARHQAFCHFRPSETVAGYEQLYRHVEGQRREGVQPV